MLTIAIISLIFGTIFIIYNYITDNNIFLPFFFIILGIFLLYLHQINKKEIPITIYHNNNIYYLYEDSLTSENGEDEVKNGNWREAYIELLTAKSVIDHIYDSVLFSYTTLPTALFPEEWNQAKKGDTLIVLDITNGIPEIGFFNHKNR